MSDPAKTPEEIEDVLASIRRLVSDHGPASERTLRPVAERAKVTPQVTDALVLTPSFRIADPGDPWAPIAAQDEIDDQIDDGGETPEDAVAALAAISQRPTRAPEQSAEWTPADRLARFDVVGKAASVSAESDDHSGFDDLDLAAESVLEDHSVEDHPAEDDLAKESLAEETLAEATLAEATLAEETLAEEDLADLIRLDGAGAGEAASEFESETGDENWPGDGAEAALLTLVARRDPVAEEYAADTADVPTFDDVSLTDPFIPATDLTPEEVAAIDPQDAGAPELMDDRVDPLSMAAPVASDAPADGPAPFDAEDDFYLTLDAGDDHTGEADAASTDDEGVTPIFSRRSRAQAAEDAATFDVDDLGADSSRFGFHDVEDGILDEDTLREIIVDVVREELQGVLGQRITRNVRKMVRREIRLALAAEDLD